LEPIVVDESTPVAEVRAKAEATRRSVGMLNAAIFGLICLAGGLVVGLTIGSLRSPSLQAALAERDQLQTSLRAEEKRVGKLALGLAEHRAWWIRSQAAIHLMANIPVLQEIILSPTSQESYEADWFCPEVAWRETGENWLGEELARWAGRNAPSANALTASSRAEIGRIVMEAARKAGKNGDAFLNSLDSAEPTTDDYERLHQEQLDAPPLRWSSMAGDQGHREEAFFKWSCNKPIVPEVREAVLEWLGDLGIDFNQVVVNGPTGAKYQVTAHREGEQAWCEVKYLGH
jgi:hypothetical protein